MGADGVLVGFRAPAGAVREDEFAVLASRGSGTVAERVREALEQPLRVAGFDIYPTVSIGSAQAEGGLDAPDPSELLRRVELAVEQAKTAGRGGAAARRLGRERLGPDQRDVRGAGRELRLDQLGAAEHRLGHRRTLAAAVGGRIVEIGSHDELLEKDGLYARYWNRQSGGFIGVEDKEAAE